LQPNLTEKPHDLCCPAPKGREPNSPDHNGLGGLVKRLNEFIGQTVTVCGPVIKEIEPVPPKRIRSNLL
jgi:hypothetical protein